MSERGWRVDGYMLLLGWVLLLVIWGALAIGASGAWRLVAILGCAVSICGFAFVATTLRNERRRA